MLTTWRKRNVLRFTTWNIKAFNDKEEVAIMQLRDHKIDICAIQEKEWNEHVDRMAEERTVKIARNKLPAGQRNTKRPRKRWSDNFPRDSTEERM